MSYYKYFGTTFYVVWRYLLFLLISYKILRFWIHVRTGESVLEISAGYHSVVVLYLEVVSKIMQRIIVSLFWLVEFLKKYCQLRSKAVLFF